ncbi:MAG TPA: cysteate synthase, partial [Candidatus Bathyarchaeia archaeon]|nr:cysteate synthase [Candidatus Bathyarchaeia archaeon]
PSIDMPDAKKSIEKIQADVLSNRKPAYSVKGGVFDALKSTNGQMYAVSNYEARRAARLFEDLEGVDIVPAAAVAAASLMQAVAQGGIGNSDMVLLNITGGGVQLLKDDKDCYQIKPDIHLATPEADLGELHDALL